jgi:hypothetical protein
MSLDATTRTLAQLAAAAGEVPRLFAELRAEFDRAAAGVSDEAAWKAFRDAWLGRKSGVLTRVTDNWLKPAAPELKRAVGAALNELRAHVESVVASRRDAVEHAAEAPPSRASASTSRCPA